MKGFNSSGLISSVLSQASLGSLRRASSDTTLETSNKIERLSAEVQQLKDKIVLESKVRDSMASLCQAELDKNAFAKAQLKKQGYGNDKIFGPK